MTDNERLLIEALGRDMAESDLLKFGRTNETPDAVRSVGNNAYDVLLSSGFDVERLEFVAAFERGYFARAAARSDPSLPWASQVAGQLAAMRAPKEIVCACGCGRIFIGRGRAKYATRACENRAYRARKKAQ